jgi:hypothetical protein
MHNLDIASPAAAIIARGFPWCWPYAFILKNCDAYVIKVIRYSTLCCIEAGENFCVAAEEAVSAPASVCPCMMVVGKVEVYSESLHFIVSTWQTWGFK